MHVVRYTDASGATVENSYTYIPYQKTVTTYGKDASFNPTVCVLSGREGADLSDSPIKSETTERILMAQAATNYCSEVLSAGLTVDPSYVQEFKSKVVENKYDEKGELIETTEYTYEPFYKWAGGLDLQFVYATATGSERVTLGATAVLVQKVVTKRDNIYAPVLAGTYLKAGEELIPVVEAQKVTTTTYTNWALTQQGQQAVAQIKDQTPFTTATQCANWLNANSTTLVLSDGQVQINRGRDIVQGQKRAAAADRIGGEKGERPESTGQLIYAAGAVGSDRIISMSMPYQSDDTYTKSGTVIRGNAAAMALRYGRTQNRLLMGNRYGVNVQIHPDRMPAHPYDPLYLSNGSLMVQYRANAANWAFSKDGVVASLDALFWGVAGGTGTSWAPVAPGVTTFPPLPTVDGNGNTTVGSVVPPWNETVPMVGVTRTVINVSDYAYSLAPLTAAAALVTRTELTVGVRLSAEAGAFQLSGKTLLTKLRASAATFIVTGQPAGSLNNRVRRHEAGTFTVTGQSAALRRTYNALAGDAAVFDLSGMPAGKFTGKTLKSDGAVFNLSGQDARLAADRKLTASNATFTLSGQDASLAKPDPYGANISLLLHMDGADGSTTFVDKSVYAHAVAANGAAQVETSTVRFGSGALQGVGGSGSTGFVSAPDHPSLEFGSGNFTIELFVNFTSTASVQSLISKGHTGTGNLSWALFRDAGRGTLQFVISTDGAGDTRKEVSWAPSTGQWYHVAVTRSAGSLRFFVDGVQIEGALASSETYFDGGAQVRVGWAVNFGLNGFIDEVRITKGVARYTANFTPPSAAFADPTLTRPLLLHFDEADGATTFVNSGTLGGSGTSTNSRISTTQHRFGTASYFTNTAGGTPDGRVPAASVPDLGSGDFTIEFWLYAVGTMWGNATFLASQGGANNDVGWSIYMFGGFNFRYSDTGGTPTECRWSSPWNWTGDTWRHVAICRSGDTLRAFIDGVQGSGTFSMAGVTVRKSTSPLCLGFNAQGNLNGYLDEVAITKRALYTANFTPPTAPYS
jgi:hypothetical protein